MPTRKPNKKRGRASSRSKTPRARAVPSKRKKPSAKKQPTRTVSSVRATKKVHAKRAGAKPGQGTSTKARAGKQPVTRKAGTAIAHAVTTVRKALVGGATGRQGRRDWSRPRRDQRSHPRTLSRWNRQPTEER